MTPTATTLTAAACAIALLATGATQAAPRWMESLDRGVVAAPAAGGGVLVSWRLLGDDPAGAAFNLYKGGKKLRPSGAKQKGLQRGLYLLGSHYLYKSIYLYLTCCFNLI